MTPERREEVADQLFSMANEIALDGQGHSSELKDPDADVFSMIDKARSQLAVCKTLTNIFKHSLI